MHIDDAVLRQQTIRLKVLGVEGELMKDTDNYSAKLKLMKLNYSMKQKLREREKTFYVGRYIRMGNFSEISPEPEGHHGNDRGRVERFI